MAIKEECLNCISYKETPGLCTQKWILPIWDGISCDCVKSKKSDQDSIPKVDNSSSKIPADKQNKSFTIIDQHYNINSQERPRHGCVTVWLWYTLLGNTISFFYHLSQTSNNENFIDEVLASSLQFFIVWALLLLFRWDKRGVYLILSIDLLLAILFLLTGEYRSIVRIVFSLSIMAFVFNMKAKDGHSFSENIGLLSRKDGKGKNNKNEK